MTAPTTAASNTARPCAKDAIALLEADPEAVSLLCEEHRNTRSVSNSGAPVAEICSSLSVHMQVEEECFCPAVKSAVKDKLLVPEGTIESADVLEPISRLNDATHHGEPCDTKVQAPSAHVKHHVEEVHTEVFPKANASSLHLIEPGARMATYQHDLLVHPESTQGRTS